MVRRPRFATLLVTVIGLGWSAAPLAQAEPQGWEAGVADLRQRWERITTAMPQARRMAALEARATRSRSDEALRDDARALLARL
ncbi:MAG: hypothetical protein R3215_18210 [Halomonas sp.]|nr:hypothetical protein [Halomonas sp.]